MTILLEVGMSIDEDPLYLGPAHPVKMATNKTLKELSS